MSLPSRERGLKFRNLLPVSISGMSLPSRERGLKYLVRKIKRAFKDVAPFAGAWIEIRQDVDSFVWTTVAPFAGAWIEMLK